MTKTEHRRTAVQFYVASFLLIVFAYVLPVLFGMAMLMLSIPFVVLSVVLLATGSYFLGASWEIKIDHCLNCDYNLTGNVSGICPERGTEVKG